MVGSSSLSTRRIAGVVDAASASVRTTTVICGQIDCVVEMYIVGAGSALSRVLRTSATTPTTVNGSAPTWICRPTGS